MKKRFNINIIIIVIAALIFAAVLLMKWNPIPQNGASQNMQGAISSETTVESGGESE